MECQPFQAVSPLGFLDFFHKMELAKEYEIAEAPAEGIRICAKTDGEIVEISVYADGIPVASEDLIVTQEMPELSFEIYRDYLPRKAADF